MDVYRTDIETYSACDLKKFGSFRYASDPSTEILLCAVQKNDGEVLLWDRFADEEANAPALALIREMSTNPCCTVWALNIYFEMALFMYLFESTFGVPAPAISKYRCSAALCRVAAIPSSLEKAAEFLKLEAGKDKKGKALIAAFSVPQKTSTPEGNLRRFPSDRRVITIAGEKVRPCDAWSDFRNYCVNDVRVEAAIGRRLARLELQGDMLEAFQLDLRMNVEGIPINLKAVEEAEKIVDDYSGRLTEQFQTLTGLTHNQNAKVLAWLQERGYRESDLRATTVARTLEDGEGEDDQNQEESGDLHPDAREALRLRRLLSFAALKKLSAMRGAACPDGKVRGAIMYYGAIRTGRWAGRLIQPQNMRRPTINTAAAEAAGNPETHQAYEMIRTGNADADSLEMLFGSPFETIASTIRHYIQPPNGGKFLDIDLAQIEARVLAWLSGHEVLLQAFRDGKDLYKLTASEMFGIPYEKVSKDDRFVGKVAALALGFYGGYNAFLLMAQVYGRKFTEKESRKIVKDYRASNKPIVDFWRSLHRAAVQAIKSPGKWVSVNQHIEFACSDGLGYRSLFMKLPCGRKLAYPLPRVRTVYKRRTVYVNAEGDECERWTEIPKARAFDWEGNKIDGIWEHDDIVYHGPITAALWGDVTLTSGQLAENAVQATAADFMISCALNAEKAGYTPVFPVHDQLIANYRPEAGNTVEGFQKAFCTLPDWAPGFPLAAEAGITDFYTK